MADLDEDGLPGRASERSRIARKSPVASLSVPLISFAPLAPFFPAEPTVNKATASCKPACG